MLFTARAARDDAATYCLSARTGTPRLAKLLPVGTRKFLLLCTHATRVRASARCVSVSCGRQHPARSIDRGCPLQITDMVTLKFGSAVCSALTEAAASGRSSSRGLLLGVAGEAALWVLWQPQKLPNLSEDELNAVRQSL